MSLPRYGKYKPSGFEWAEQLPAHWSVGRLKWLAQRYSGGTPDKSRIEFWEDGTLPWLNSGAVNDGLILEPSAYITREGFESSSAKWIPPGSLLMALAGQGKTKGMVAQLMFESTCNQSMAAIVPGPEVHARFLYWWLACNYQNIRNMAGGDLRDGLNLDLLGSIPCPLPRHQEQVLIAAFLDRETAKIDTLIVEQEKLIALLAEKRQATISHAVTKGLDPSTPMKDSGIPWLGEVPAHWETWKVSHAFAAIGSGTTPPSDETGWYDGGATPWVTTGELRENVIFETSKNVTDEALVRFSALRVHPAGSLLIAMYGATIGRLAVLGVPAASNQACCALSGPIHLDVRFTFYWLQAFKKFLIDLFATGGGQPNISKETITSLRVPAPDLDEQIAIVARLDGEMAGLNALTLEAEIGIGLLKERRAALIAAAVTGQIDVRGLVEEQVA